jgi:hypothetical protein
MGIVFPSEAVARRWSGALQARLRRAPLEEFLRAQGMALAPVGAAQDSDNLVRASGFIVDAGLKRYLHDRKEVLTLAQQAVTGHVACLVSRALAELISEAAVWRVVALVTTARVLSPWIGLNTAAIASASFVRHFRGELSKPASAMDLRISESASAAIGNRATGVSEVSALIAMSLASESAQHSVSPIEAPPELQARG